MLLKILFLVLFLSLFVRWWRRRRKIQCCEQFKNDGWTLPFLGHAHLLLGSTERKMRGFQKLGREALKQGGVTYTYSWLSDFFFAVVADPITAEAVLKNSLEKDDVMKMFKSVMGDGILISPVPVWRPRRKILNPTFGLKNLNQFVETFGKHSMVLVDKLKSEVGLGPFSIYDYVSYCSLDSICETILGTELGSQKNHRHPVVRALHACYRLAAHRICLPLLYNQTVYDLTPYSSHMNKSMGILNKFINSIISEKLQKVNDKALNEVENSQSEIPKTIIQLMIENSNSEVPATPQYLLDETKVVTFAGTDTTSVAFSFVMMMLASHHDVQEKVYNEISEVLGDITRAIEPKDLPQLKYTEAVIKETIRLFPPVPIIVRKLDEDLILPNGKTLVEGVSVLINIWAVHRNTQYWGADAEQFRPERFLEPLTHPAAFLGFSYGVRNCIGFSAALMFLKTSITSVLRQFKVTSAYKQTDTHEPLRVQFDIILKHVDNFKIQLNYR